MPLAYFIATGLFAGTLAGIFGVGGGLIIVPILIFILNFNTSAATATSLVALLAPVGIGGVYAYYQAGRIDMTHIKAGLLISVGMFVGSYLGARFALSYSDLILKRAFAVFLMLVAARFWMSTVGK